MNNFHRVANLSDLDNGEIVAASVEGRDVVVYRVDNEVRAVQRYCVHQGADLTEGLISRGSLLCSAHGWRFDAHTGVLDTSPETCLATFETKVDGQDVYVSPTPRYRGKSPA